MTDRALLGSGDPDRSVFEPARLPGHGSVPAPVARAWLREGLAGPPSPATATAADASPATGSDPTVATGTALQLPAAARVWVRRLYTTPDGRDLVAMDSRRRVFGGMLRRMPGWRGDGVHIGAWHHGVVHTSSRSTSIRRNNPPNTRRRESIATRSRPSGVVYSRRTHTRAAAGSCSAVPVATVGSDPVAGEASAAVAVAATVGPPGLRAARPGPPGPAHCRGRGAGPARTPTGRGRRCRAGPGRSSPGAPPPAAADRSPAPTTTATPCRPRPPPPHDPPAAPRGTDH